MAEQGPGQARGPVKTGNRGIGISIASVVTGKQHGVWVPRLCRGIDPVLVATPGSGNIG